MASLLRLALSFDMFSLVNSNFKKAPPPGCKMHFKENDHKCNINIKSVIIHKQMMHNKFIVLMGPKGLYMYVVKKTKHIIQ